MIRFVFIIFITTISLKINAQEITITISAGNKTITASLENKSDDKEISIQKNTKGYLMITVANEWKDWKRSFFIDDDGGADLFTAVAMQQDEYCIKISELEKKLKVYKTYFLYTVALPKDPKKAKLVRVARRLVCTIKLID